MQVKNMVGICGIYCGTCPTYLASRINDLNELLKISGNKGIPLEEVYCDGCLSERVFKPCIDYRYDFRQCAVMKKVTWYFECPDFPCQRLEFFKDIHVINEIYHHKNVIKNLQYMKENGVERFVEEQKKKYRCPKCVKILYWYLHKCSDCNTSLTD